MTLRFISVGRGSRLSAADENIHLGNFQLRNPQEDIPALAIEDDTPELDSERLCRAVEEEITNFDESQRTVCCVLLGVPSSNIGVSVSIQGASSIVEWRVFFLDSPGTEKLS